MLIFFINKKREKKLFFISALALCFNVMALDIKPYVSGKINYNIFSEASLKLNDYSDEGIIIPNKKFKDSGFGGSLAIGLFNSNKNLPIRVEFEFFRSSDFKDKVNMNVIYKPDPEIPIGVEIPTNIEFKYNITSYMMNFYYDFYNNTNLIPYAGLGLGVSTANGSYNIDMNLNGFHYGVSESNNKSTTFTWQLLGGSYYKINDSLFVDVGIKYNNIKFKYVDINTLTLSFGIRYNLIIIKNC